MHLQNHPSSGQWRNLIFKITLASLLLSRSASSAHKFLTIAMNPVLDLNSFCIITTKFKNLIIMHYLGSALFFLFLMRLVMHARTYSDFTWIYLCFGVPFDCTQVSMKAHNCKCKVYSLWSNVCMQLFSSLFMEMTTRDGCGVVFCFVFGQWYGVDFLFVFIFVF